jgi:superfamily II DNA/RNA helicase
LVTEKGNKLQQRNDLFDGTEIIIGTPKRLYELYIQNGYNVGEISVFVVDDLDQQMKKGLNMQISRLTESLPKCQHVYLTNSTSDVRVQQYLETIVPHAQVVEER